MLLFQAERDQYFSQLICQDHYKQNLCFEKIIKEKVQKAAFKQLIEMKEKCKKILAYVTFKKHETQPYMISSKFNLQEIKLLFSLRILFS